MKTLQQFNDQKQRIVARFLKNRDAAIKNEISGKVWCHTPPMIEFWAKWDRKWNKIQKAFDSVWVMVSAKFN